MEPLIDACAADHCRTHYGNFQLEEPASVRLLDERRTADLPERDTKSCTAGTNGQQEEWAGVYPLHFSSETDSHEAEETFDAEPRRGIFHKD
ncbi:Beta-glucosidase 7 [Dissostichus eleginoides]|uniref:Beta-glucosidase 7 n=1 Tax=Dissostichus eleginoides TaxID=100907 RepID=A0AAD9BMU1_DISEL|nr:Beta-glucosidase 7 [Dissostichus eleginoides]